MYSQNTIQGILGMYLEGPKSHSARTYLPATQTTASPLPVLETFSHSHCEPSLIPFREGGRCYLNFRLSLGVLDPETPLRMTVRTPALALEPILPYAPLVC